MSTEKHNERHRDGSLDALRGLSVIGMILSGAIAFGDVLPAWMFHAQLPPPAHKFNPSLPGITWVDLVFPFFLFCLGAAIPLAMKASVSTKQLWITALRRFAILVWFALFSYHMRAAVLVTSATTVHHLCSLAAFALAGVVLMSKQFSLPIRLTAFAVSIAMMFGLPIAFGREFNASKSDIILIVLANMSLFGTLIYGYSIKLSQTLNFCSTSTLRVLTLVAVGAVLVAVKGGAAAPTESIAHAVFNATPAGWLYRFDYLKYLFLVIPAMQVGEWLRDGATLESEVKPNAWSVALLCLLLIVGVTGLLFTREVYAAAGFSAAVLTTLIFVSAQQKGNALSVDAKLVMLAGVLAALGFLFEPYQGGIKKDPSSFSYWLITGALSCVSLVGLKALYRTSALMRSTLLRPFETVGQNAMLAYVAGNLIVTPLLHLTTLYPMWASMKQNALWGFAKGVLYTAIVAVVTILFTRRGWVWKA